MQQGTAWERAVRAAGWFPRGGARLLAVVVQSMAFALSGCREASRPEVVLYTSCDDYLLRDVIAPFEKETGITVRLAGDTEATKTIGLVQRLIAERDRPRADVWWSNEPFGTMRLADEGLLAPFKPRALTEDFNNVWPLDLRARDDTWYGFALRARVIVYNTQRVKEPPRTLRELADPKWKGRIGMARPQFGTTRGHMAAVVASCGEAAFREWLSALRSNGIRLYDGNSAVVRAAAHGEIDAGLTDTDDVFVGQRERWPVEMVVEGTASGGAPGLCAVGPCPIPNTVGILRNAPHPEAARRLADYLLSREVERVLTESESRNSPLRGDIASAGSVPLALLSGAAPNLHGVHGAIPAAMRACTEILGD